MTDEPILFAVARGVATITLNRPARLNALTADMLVMLRDRLDEAADAAVRAVLIEGADANFCAGQDLGERDPARIAWPPDLEELQTRLYHPVITRMARLRKPVVVAVGGVAAGAGVSLALAGDIVVAGRSARFIPSFSKIGLSVDAGGGWHLARLLGPARAKALLMTGETIAADEAARIGLIWRCVADADLAANARTLAESLAQGPTQAYAAIKQAIAASDEPVETYLRTEAALQGVAGRSADYLAGVSAFLAKRPASFSGL